MKIIYEENFIEKVLNEITNGNTSIIYDDNNNYLECIEKSFKAKGIDYKKFKIEEGGIEGFKNIIGIGGDVVATYLSKNAIEYSYIPTKTNDILDYILKTRYVESINVIEPLYVNPTNIFISKNIDIDKKRLLDEFSFLKISIGEIVPLYKNEEEFILDAINNIPCFFKMPKDFYLLREKYIAQFQKETYNSLYIFGFIILSLDLFSIKHINNINTPINFNEEIIKLSKRESIFTYEILNIIKDKKDLSIKRYTYKNNIILFTQLIETSLMNMKLNSRLYKSFCENFGYKIEVDVSKIINFIKEYSIVLNPENILFQTWL